jgi:P-type Ca2+ transporter type 2C
MTTIEQAPAAEPTWYTLSADDAVARLRVDAEQGLGPDEVERRLAQYGRNEIAAEPPPTLWEVAKGQLANPMNIMLLIVSIASLAIGQVATGVIVAALVSFNVIMGTSQERKASASVEALAGLQVPRARVRRSGRVEEVESSGLVPGDLVMLEAGDLVPADGRVATSATLEVAEAALTGESAPVAKDAATLDADDVPLGDRANMLFQNTSVTRGTAVMMVTATGSDTEMGKIAGLLTSVTRTKSPLQKELDGVTRWLGLISWLAVAVIVVVGWVRGLEFSTLVLLAVSTAIAAIPTGLPTFVQPCSQRCSSARRGQGGREEPHRRRDSRLDERHQQRQDRHADAERDDRHHDAHRWPLVHRAGQRVREGGRHPACSRGRPPTSPRSHSASRCAATPRSRTTGLSSATPPRRHWSYWPPRSASTPR